MSILRSDFLSSKKYTMFTIFMYFLITHRKHANTKDMNLNASGARQTVSVCGTAYYKTIENGGDCGQLGHALSS